MARESSGVRDDLVNSWRGSRARRPHRDSSDPSSDQRRDTSERAETERFLPIRVAGLPLAGRDSFSGEAYDDEACELQRQGFGQDVSG